MDFGNLVSNLLGQMAFFHLSAGNYIMIGVALVFLYLAIAKGFEPLLLIPIAFGMLLVNIYPDIMYSPEQTSNGVGGLLYYFFTLDEWSILPSLFLLAAGALLLKFTDPLSWLTAFFLSVSARTAGFATLDLGKLSNAGLFTILILMFIGASPGSTGGGIKTTTIFVLAQEIRCIFSKQRPGAFRRALPANAIAKASTIGLLGMLVVCCTTFLLCILEPGLPFISLLFEAVSAYSTAGLSTGITAQLCLAAKLVLIFTMYTGRVGAFTLLSLWVERPEPNAHFTEEAITIG